MTTQEASGRARFDAQYDLLVGLVAQVARRKGLDGETADELRAEVMLKVVEDDYAVLRAYRGRSSWRTYLTVVIQRVLLDLRTKSWGRWRPSAAARRLGPQGIELDRFIHRDGLSVDEAVASLAPGADPGEKAALFALAHSLPRRTRRRFVEAHESLHDRSDVGSSAHRVTSEEATALCGEVACGLRRGIGALPDDDREAVRLRFVAGWSVQRIAKAQGRPAKGLYRRFGRILCALRRQLEAENLDWQRVSALFDDTRLRDGLLDLNGWLRQEGAEEPVMRSA